MECEVFLPNTREKALKMRVSMPKRLKDEDLHAEKASKTKTSTPRRHGNEDLRAEKALKMKTSIPRKAQK
jgi:hypothetical protein